MLAFSSPQVEKKREQHRKGIFMISLSELCCLPARGMGCAPREPERKSQGLPKQASGTANNDFPRVIQSVPSSGPSFTHSLIPCPSPGCLGPDEKAALSIYHLCSLMNPLLALLTLQHLLNTEQSLPHPGLQFPPSHNHRQASSKPRHSSQPYPSLPSFIPWGLLRRLSE